MDTVDLLFAPNDYDYSSRYQWKWVHDGIDIKQLRGKKALLVFLGESQAGLYYMPLREAFISEVSDHGPFVVVRYRLGRFVHMGMASHQFAVEFDHKLCDFMRESTIEQGRSGKLVFSLSGISISFSTREEDDDHNWANLVNEVVRSPAFNDSVFLRFSGLVEEETGQPMGFEDGRFYLRSSGVYRLDIVQYLPDRDGEGRPMERKRTLDLGKLELETIEMHINVLVDELEVLGRYDDHTFYFVCEKLNEKVVSRIGLLGKGVEGFYIPSLYFQVQIAPRRQVWLGYASFFFGLLIIGISTVLPGTELILAAAGSVVSTGGLLLLEGR